MELYKFAELINRTGYQYIAETAAVDDIIQENPSYPELVAGVYLLFLWFSCFSHTPFWAEYPSTIFHEDGLNLL